MKFEMPTDLKDWYAISCPTTGLRFDARTLELMDSNHDGRIRTDEVLAALAYLKANGVTTEDLFVRHEEDEKKLAEVLSKIADLAKLEPSELEKAALTAWETEGKEAKIAICGEGTAAAEKDLAAVEGLVDAFFTPAADLPLVTDEPDCELPLNERLNPLHAEAIRTFAATCVKPVLGERAVLTRFDWKAVKAAFAPYRAWVNSKPVVNAEAKAELEAEERLLRYKLNLGEFLVNYVTMDRLYADEKQAIFQMGVLRIDGKELELCFHVENEGAHAALAEKSRCCVVYLKLTNPAQNETRGICAVVTAGTVDGLYVGRNGVFYDRDGGNWEAVITKVVESQVSLAEAFWAPWRKLGDGIAAAVKKFLADRQAKSTTQLQKTVEQPATGGGAAMASSVAAIGIGVGMLGAACASVLAVVKNMGPWQFVGAVIALILLASLPSVILTWFKLRKRDLGAILNASGWAINREMRFSMRRARTFTKCAKTPVWWLYALLIVLVCALAGWTYYCHSSQQCEYKQIDKTQEVTK